MRKKGKKIMEEGAMNEKRGTRGIRKKKERRKARKIMPGMRRDMEVRRREEREREGEGGGN